MSARRFRAIGILFFLLFACLFTPPLRADSGNFKIDSYIPQRFTDLSWTVSGSTSLQSYRGTSDYYEDYGSNRTSYSSQRLSANSSATWRYITVPRFLTVDLSLGSAFYRQPSHATNDRIIIPEPEYSVSSDSKSTARYLELTGSPYVDGGVYVWNDLFLSATASANSQYRNGPSENEDVSYHYHFVGSDDRVNDLLGYAHSKTTGNYRSNHLSGELLPGLGRVYEGNYAATGLYMINALREHGLLTREPSVDEMRALTDLIYNYRLRHTPDKRIRRIEALSAITVFLQKNHISDTLGAAGYLAAQDVWDYYPTYSRQFGFRLRTGIGWDYTYASRNTSSASSYFDTTISYMLGTPEDADTVTYANDMSSYNHYSQKTQSGYALVLFEYYRPLATQWQFDGQIRLLYYLNEWTLIGNNRTEYENHALSLLTAMLQYIPDSRTNAGLRLTSGYETYRDRSRSQGSATELPPYVPFSPDRHNFSIELAGFLTYRIAIPTTLSINGSYGYREYENIYSDADESTRRFILAAGINHYIF
jgi:hypothetical protein